MKEKVDNFFEKYSKWQQEYLKLRAIINECGLTEELKWGVPCYTFNNKNIVLIHGFKNYCALLFFKGVFLEDAKELLIQQTKNVQAGRQLRFSSLLEINKLEATIKAYTFEAIEIEKAGLEIKKKETSKFEIPIELKQIFKRNPTFEKAFNNLTEGRKRGYLFHFSQAKQAKTRETRIEKNKQRILNGYGLNDCTCGKSKRMPNCDGSHKH